MHVVALSRYSKFMEMYAKGDVKLENLPPTDSTAISHSLRVHQQTITWETLAAITPNLLHSGWKDENGKLTPKQTDENVAPSDLLKFKRSSCKSLKNMYSTIMQKIWFKICSGMWQT